MKYLILGGNGYLGSKVCKSLINRGDFIFCTRRNKSDLSRLSDCSEITWISDKLEEIEESIRNEEVDVVINFVCDYGKHGDMRKVLTANLLFPLEILEMSCELGIKNWITVGTPLPALLNTYSLTKNQFATWGEYYVNSKGISFTNILLEMFYGYDEPRDRFIPSLVYKMIRGETVNTTIGTQKRDIIAVDDVVKAFHIILSSDLHGYNEISVGTGVASSISELVDYIWKNTGSKSIVNKGTVPMRANEPDSVACNETISALGEWNPTMWKQGIQDMIEMVKRNEAL